MTDVTPSPGEELRQSLAAAAADPSPDRIAAVLRHIAEKDIRSEWQRRLNARRTTMRGSHWLNHYPEHKFCQCEGCRLKRGAKTRGHRHQPLAFQSRPADMQSPGCKDKRCIQPHVIERCKCGALGVTCPRYPYTLWYKETNEQRKDNAK